MVQLSHAVGGCVCKGIEDNAVEIEEFAVTCRRTHQRRFYLDGAARSAPARRVD